MDLKTQRFSKKSPFDIGGAGGGGMKKNATKAIVSIVSTKN